MVMVDSHCKDAPKACFFPPKTRSEREGIGQKKPLPPTPLPFPLGSYSTRKNFTIAILFLLIYFPQDTL